MKIDFFHERSKSRKIKKEIFKSVNSILALGQYTNGPNVKKFENRFKKIIKAKYCVAVNNGTSALHLALLSLGIKKGDEIIVPSMTFIASAAAIDYVGAKPIFVDVNQKDWLIDSRLIEKKITKKTKAIVVVHLHGLMCDMKEINNIAKKHKLFVIEDSAQALGSKYNDKNPGFYSDIATFSFYPTKNLGAIGEGGAITTNNKIFFEKSYGLRSWATSKDSFTAIGYNYRMTEFVACSLIVKLKFLFQDIKKRISIANYYKKKIKLKTYSKFNYDLKKHSYHIFALKIKNRNHIIKELNKKNIATNSHYAYCLPMLKIFKDHKKKSNNGFPYGNELSKQILSLPIYPELNKNEMEYIIKNINTLIEKS